MEPIINWQALSSLNRPSMPPRSDKGKGNMWDNIAPMAFRLIAYGIRFWL